MSESKIRDASMTREQQVLAMQFHREVCKQVFFDSLGSEHKTIDQVAKYAVQCADSLLLAMSTPRKATQSPSTATVPDENWSDIPA